MQLPRGTFRSIKKGIALHAICHDLTESHFTGCCTFTSGPRTCTFVMESGRCILAEDQELQGHAAWAAIIKDGGREGEAVLADLSGAQIKISREFNKAADLGESSRPPALFREKAPAHDPAATAKGGTKPEAKREAVQPDGGRQHLRRGSADANRAPREHALETDGFSLVDRDLDALDAMDIETMTEKIRSSAKMTVERLHLEHLMDND